MDRPTNEVLGRLSFLANTRGIIPNPITATRVNSRNTVSGAASTTVYTVGVGEVLFIPAISLDVICGATIGAGLMQVKNKAGAVQYYIGIIRLGVASTRDHIERYFCPALEAAAEWYVEITGSAATLYVDGIVNGWVETA